MKLLPLIILVLLPPCHSSWFKNPLKLVSDMAEKSEILNYGMNIGQHLDDIQDGIGDLVDLTKGLTEDVISMSNEHMERVIDEGKKTVEQAKEKASQMMEQGKEQAEQVRRKVERVKNAIAREGTIMMENGALYAKHGAKVAEENVRIFLSQVKSTADNAYGKTVDIYDKWNEFTINQTAIAMNISTELAAKWRNFAKEKGKTVSDRKDDFLDLMKDTAQEIEEAATQGMVDMKDFADVISRQFQHMDVMAKMDAVVKSARGKEVCYPPYGCINNEAPFDRPLVLIPRDPVTLDTKFLLHTRKTWFSLPRKPKLLRPLVDSDIFTANFDGKKETVFFIHGFLETRTEWYVKPYFRQFLRHGDMNVFFVDWTKGASFPYMQAVGDSRIVGAQVGHMIESLHNLTSLKIHQCHVIGFSLGAHVAGHAGAWLKNRGHVLGRITGLDPASPSHESLNPAVRLDESDAKFVDVIHTDTKTLFVKGLGASQPMGDVDFYPNGGFEQPGCRVFTSSVKRLVGCSHYRAINYFLESINSRCKFTARKCASYYDFLVGKCESCSKRKCRRLGYFSNDRTRIRTKGSYYLSTKRRSPFCKK